MNNPCETQARSGRCELTQLGRLGAELPREVLPLGTAAFPGRPLVHRWESGLRKTRRCQRGFPSRYGHNLRAADTLGTGVSCAKGVGNVGTAPVGAARLD